jgi:hypothetical protein
MWSDHIKSISEKIAENVKASKAAEDDDQETVEVPYSEADITDEQFDTYIKLCTLGLEDELRGDKTIKQFTEYLENNLDEPTIQRILEVCGGLKLSDADPNQIPTGTAL